MYNGIDNSFGNCINFIELNGVSMATFVPA
jgi:hypothetical protein